MEGFAGVTAIDASAGAMTVILVVPLIVPALAVIVELPVALAVAEPPLVMVAADVDDELQVADAVRSWVLLSLNVPVALNCCVAPFGTEGFAGVTAIDCNTGAVTVSVVEPLIVPEVALIVLDPVATVVANPALLIVATVVVPEVQVTVLVIFCVLLSVYLPVAVNCCVNPLVTDAFAGVTLIELKAIPTPVNDAVCGLLLSLSVTFNIPVPPPLPSRFKITFIV